LNDALVQALSHRNAAKAIAAQYPKHIDYWEQWINDYLIGNKKDDPYLEPHTGTTMNYTIA
jgi:hypothetical protein